MDEDQQRRNITLADWGAGTFGNNVSVWGGRYLDVRSPAVREVQRRRLEWMAGIGCDGVDPGERQKWPFWGGPQGCVEAWHCGRHPNEPQRVPQAGIPGAAPAAAGPNRNPPPLPACPLSRQH